VGGHVTSSVSANGGEALCGTPFPQVVANRRGQRYAFSFRVPNALANGGEPSNDPAIGSYAALALLAKPLS
jgi:hypothetical protein